MAVVSFETWFCVKEVAAAGERARTCVGVALASPHRALLVSAWCRSGEEMPLNTGRSKASWLTLGWLLYLQGNASVTLTLSRTPSLACVAAAHVIVFPA